MSNRFPMSSEQLDRLREFGLSEYGARAYVALLQVGGGDARTIARLAKIPIAKVYSTLEQLQRRGLARMIVESPKRFEPVPIAEFLAELRQSHLREAERIVEITPELARLFEIRSADVPSDRGSIAVVRGRRSVLAKYSAMAGEASHDMLLVLTPGAGRRLATLAPVVQDAQRRRVNVRVLAPLDPEHALLFAPLAPWAELRARDPQDTQEASVGYGIFDGREAFVTHFVPDDGSLHDGHDFGFVLTEEAVVRSLRDILDAQWRRASPPKTGQRRTAP